MFGSTKRRLRKALLLPLRALLRRMELGDPWESSGAHAPYQHFATGSRHRFGWYLDDKSSVRVDSVEDICAWLAECEYRSDPELFGEADYWQHPKTFELLRAGDCEDFALWAWRKLQAIGVSSARLFVGGVNERRRGHAWVVFEDKGVEWVLEGAAKGHPQLRELTLVRNSYEPWYSVGSDLRRTIHVGFLYRLRRHGRRSEPVAPGAFCLTST